MSIAIAASSADGYEVDAYNPQGNVPRGERLTAATQLLVCKAPEVVICGPAGTGKSLALLHRLNAVLCKYAGARALLVRKTRSSLTESALVTYESKVIPRNLAVYPDVQSTQRRIRNDYPYPNGSVLVVGGMDTPERIMSTEYDLVAVPEATELDEHDWELLLTRLRNGVIPGYQQIIADCNPTYPGHWLNRRMNEGKAVRLLSRHEDNPALWDGQDWTVKGKSYLDKLRSLSGARYLRLFKGVWAAAEGIVYPDFDPARHVVDPFHVPASWRRFRAIDFGFRHPFVCSWFAQDGDGVVYRYRQVYYSGRIVEDHARQINQLSGDEKYEVTLADHDAEDRATLHRQGIRTQAAWKQVRPGIDAVTARLREGRLLFFRDAEVDGVRYGRVERDPVLSEAGRPTSDVEEFDTYAYAAARDGQLGKEEPVKEFDDGLDTVRYGIAWVDDVSRRRFKVRGGRVGAGARLARAG
jgi:phage terminase large subunit